MLLCGDARIRMPGGRLEDLRVTFRFLRSTTTGPNNLSTKLFYRTLTEKKKSGFKFKMFYMYVIIRKTWIHRKQNYSIWWQSIYKFRVQCWQTSRSNFPPTTAVFYLFLMCILKIFPGVLITRICCVIMNLCSHKTEISTLLSEGFRIVTHYWIVYKQQHSALVYRDD